MDREAFVPRLSIKRTGIRKRHLAYTAQEKVEYEEVCKQFLEGFVVHEYLRNIVFITDEDMDRFGDYLVIIRLYLAALTLRGWQLSHVPILRTRVPKLVKKELRIYSVQASECWSDLRFRKEDIQDLYDRLGFEYCAKAPGGRVRLENGSTMHPEHIFLMWLYIMAFPRKYDDVSKVFGRETTQNQRAFNFFLTWFCDTWGHLIKHDSLKFWVDFFPLFASKVQDKMTSILEEMGEHGGSLTDDLANVIVAFIDCTVLEVPRPGGGPMDNFQQHSCHWPTYLQESFFNGWKSRHGLKYQGVKNPMGYEMCLYGPISCRFSDLAALQESKINERLAEVQRGNDVQYVQFGDDIYITDTHTKSKPTGRLSEAWKRIFEAVKRLRVTVEWGFRDTKTNFSYVKRSQNLKVLGSSDPRLPYVAATLLQNMHSCYYGNETSAYFDLPTPTIECYLAQNASLYTNLRNVRD